MKTNGQPFAVTVHDGTYTQEQLAALPFWARCEIRNASKRRADLLDALTEINARKTRQTLWTIEERPTTVTEPKHGIEERMRIALDAITKATS